MDTTGFFFLEKHALIDVGLIVFTKVVSKERYCYIGRLRNGTEKYNITIYK